MTSPIGAPGPGARAGVAEVGDVVDGAVRVVLGGTVNDGVDRSASPPTDCEHPATSTDAAIRPAIRITAKASGPTRDRWPGAAGCLFDTVGSCTNTSSAQPSSRAPSKASLATV